MLPMLRVLTSVTAGVLMTLQCAEFFKTANEEQSAHILGDIGETQSESLAAEPLQPKPPLNMGSENINAALQNILDSDATHKEPATYMDAKLLKSKHNYTLGSESLNQMLREIMPSGAEANSSVVFEPAVDL